MSRRPLPDHPEVLKILLRETSDFLQKYEPVIAKWRLLRNRMAADPSSEAALARFLNRQLESDFLIVALPTASSYLDIPFLDGSGKPIIAEYRKFVEPSSDRAAVCDRYLTFVRRLHAEIIAKLDKKSGLSVDGNNVTVDGKTYPLDDGPAAFVKALVDAGPGVWVSGSKMGMMVRPRADRVFRKLPDPIQAMIESQTGAGYRIRPL